MGKTPLSNQADPVVLERSRSSFLQGMPLSLLRESSFPAAAAVQNIALQQAWKSYALAVSQRSSVSTTTIPVQRIRILFLPNSFAARPFKPMKGATKCALARTEYSRASSPEKPGRERHSCLPCPKRSKFFCSDMSRWIPTVAGY